MQAGLEESGRWELLARSGALPYLPENDYYFNQNVTLTHFVFRVR